MNRKNILYLRYIFEIFYNALPCAGVLVGLDYLFALGWKHSASVLAAVLFQSLIFYSEKKGGRLQCFGGLLLLNGGLAYYFYKHTDKMEWFLTYLGLEVVCILLSILCYAAGKRLWMKFLFFLLLSGVLIYCSMNQIDQMKWEVCLLLLYFLLFLSEAAESRYDRAFGHGKRNMLYLFPIFCAVSIFLFCLPTKTTPIRWEYVKSIAKTVKDKVNDIVLTVEYYISGIDHTYALSFTGYDSDGALGGSILDSDSVELWVKGTKTKSPLYLGGSIYQEYTGKDWRPPEEDKTYQGYEYKANFNEITLALQESGAQNEKNSQFRNYCSIHVYFEGLKTRSLFLAPLTSDVNLPENVSLSEKQGDALTMKRPQKQGFDYNLGYVELDYSNQHLEDLLRQGSRKDNAAKKEKRKKSIQKEYTKLPESLPNRVKELAVEITADADTDYDKLRILEVYLRNYTYTKKPPKMPKGRDFTDYFLFEGKSGYCTYFATAMAVMGRCVGIPTRYVEGFVTTETMKEQDGRIPLTGADAHAWPEAYIDGVGWIPFEPTPGYSQSSISGWGEEKEIDWENTKKYKVRPDTPGSSEVEHDTEFITDEKEESHIKDYSLLGVRIILIVILWVGFVGAVVALRRFLYRLSYQRKTAYEKILILMQRMLNMGTLYKKPIEEGETLSDYCTRMNGILDIVDGTFAKECALFEKIRFGGKEVDAKDITQIETYVRALEGKYRKECGWMKKIWFSCVRF